MTDVSLLILLSLADGAKHGYSIQQDVQANTGVRLGPGSLYGAISRLENEELIEPLEEGERRKPYRLTPRGLTEIRERIDKMRLLVTQADSRLAAQ